MNSIYKNLHTRRRRTQYQNSQGRKLVPGCLNCQQFFVRGVWYLTARRNALNLPSQHPWLSLISRRRCAHLGRGNACSCIVAVSGTAAAYASQVGVEVAGAPSYAVPWTVKNRVVIVEAAKLRYVNDPTSENSLCRWGRRDKTQAGRRGSNCREKRLCKTTREYE